MRAPPHPLQLKTQYLTLKYQKKLEAMKEPRVEPARPTGIDGAVKDARAFLDFLRIAAEVKKVSTNAGLDVPDMVITDEMKSKWARTLDVFTAPPHPAQDPLASAWSAGTPADGSAPSEGDDDSDDSDDLPV